MVKIVLFLFILILVLIFPIYENSRIKINTEELKNFNIPLAEIKRGKFFVYDVNLSKKGNFLDFEIYKKFYKAKKVSIKDLIKKEEYIADKLLLKQNNLKLFNLKYKNNNYFLISNYVIYNLKDKNIKGNKFFLYANDYNGSGKRFFIDSNRDINASFISFYIKVNK